jgi:hypothetical protein
VTPSGRHSSTPIPHLSLVRVSTRGPSADRSIKCSTNQRTILHDIHGVEGRGVEMGRNNTAPFTMFSNENKKKLGNAKHICCWGGVNYLPIFAFHRRFLKCSPHEKRRMCVY